MFWAVPYCLKMVLSPCSYMTTWLWLWCIQIFRGTFLWVEIFFFFMFHSFLFAYYTHSTRWTNVYGSERIMYVFSFRNYTFFSYDNVPIWQKNILFSLLMTKENYFDARHFIVFSTFSASQYCRVTLVRS